MKVKTIYVEAACPNCNYKNIFAYNPDEIHPYEIVSCGDEENNTGCKVDFAIEIPVHYIYIKPTEIYKLIPVKK